MDYTRELNRQWCKIIKSHQSKTSYFENIDVLPQLNNKNISDFSKIKVNIERKKIDKYVPNRYIPKIGDNGKMYKMLDVIAKDELKYIQYATNQYEKNHYFNESRCPKLNSIRADVFKQEAIFKDMIFKGIKSDIETIGLYRHEPEKTNLKAINNAEIEEKLVSQALIDISNFTSQNHRLINSQINEIYNNNNKIVRNQKQIDEIGFWKGNFFGTKDEKILYEESNLVIDNLNKENDITYNELKNNIDKTIRLSTISYRVDSEDDILLPMNFENHIYKDNAIAHANTELELKDIIESEHQDSVPQFLIDRDFSKNADSEHINSELTEFAEWNSQTNELNK